jgi:hypothetical protein
LATLLAVFAVLLAGVLLLHRWPWRGADPVDLDAIRHRIATQGATATRHGHPACYACRNALHGATMMDKNEAWALPGILVGAVGVFALVAGFATDGPDKVGGVVFGVVGLATAAVILWRRTPTSRQRTNP